MGVASPIRAIARTNPLWRNLVTQLDPNSKLATLQYKAEDGDLESMFLLGVAFAQGKACKKDHSSAARWFFEASRRGHLRAKTSLGYLYFIGQGVKQDVIQCYIFLSEAADAGDVLAMDLIVKVKRKMSESQLMEANRRLRKIDSSRILSKRM